MQDAINKMITAADRAIPMYFYTLADYQGERLATCAPIHVGDFISVRLSDDSVIDEKKVTKILHLDEPINVGDQILTTFLTLED